MKNVNFGFDCRNNANNTKFDEIGEITYIKKYNLFGSQVANFVKSDILEQNINEEYEQKMQKMVMIKENDPFKDPHIA